MTRQAELNGCTESEPVLCAFIKSKQTTYDTSTLDDTAHRGSSFFYFMNDALIGELMPINDGETVNPLTDTYSKNA